MKKNVLIAVLSFIIVFITSACNQEQSKVKGKPFDYTLQMSIDKLVYKWAGDKQSDSLFQKAFTEAVEAKKQSNRAFIDLYSEVWIKQNPSVSLAYIFNSKNGFSNIQPESNTEDVIMALKTKINQEVKRLMHVLGNRVEEFGLQNIKFEKTKGDRVKVFGDGLKNPKRLAKILTTPANVGYWPTYSFSERAIYEAVIQADDTLRKYYKAFAKDSIEQNWGLFNYLAPNFVQNESGAYYPGEGPLLGYAKIEDTAKVNAMLCFPFVKKLFPKDIVFIWGVKPPSYLKTEEGKQLKSIELFMVRAEDGKDIAPVSNEDMADVAVFYGDNGQAQINVTMNKKGAQLWETMTRNNLRKSIAIVIDNRVFSAPTVQSEISGGRSMITGNFDEEEMSDFVVMIKGGKLNIPVRIVQ
jgi:SecD/SecF fusion protein